MSSPRQMDNDAMNEPSQFVVVHGQGADKHFLSIISQFDGGLPSVERSNARRPLPARRFNGRDTTLGLLHPHSLAPVVCQDTYKRESQLVISSSLHRAITLHERNAKCLSEATTKNPRNIRGLP